MIKLFSSAGDLIDMIHATVATIHQEINGEYSCQVQADYDLQAGMIVELEDANGSQLFRLEKPVKNMETSTAFGWHITQDLAKDIITNREWSGAGSAVWPDIVQAGISERRFSGTSNISTVASSRMVRRSVLASMIGSHETSFLSRWGGELQRDNYTVNMLNRLGANNGYQVLFGKNLTAFEATIDDSQIVNRIIPTFLGASGGTLLLPEVYIDSPRINQTPVPHCMSIHYGDIQVGAEVDEVIPYPTLESAQTEVRNRIEQLYLHGADQPLLTVEIGFAELRNTEEYKDYAWLETVSLGDDVRLEYESYTVDDRVIAYDWDALRKEYTQIILGRMKPSLDAMTASIATQVANESAVNLQRHVTSLVLAIAELNQSVANASGMFSTKIDNADGSFILYYHDSPTLETSQVIEYYPEPGTRVWTDTGWNEGLPSWKYGYDQHGLLVMRMISTIGLRAEWIAIGDSTLTDKLDAVDAATSQMRLEAETAANAYTVAQLDAEKVRADAYADNVLTLAEQKALEEANDALSEAQSNLLAANENLKTFVRGHVSDELSELKTYIRTDPVNGNLLIGKPGSKSILRQSNLQMTFEYNGEPVAYFGAGETDMPKAGVDTELRIGDKAAGNYYWVSDADGGMSLVWK